MTEQEEFVSPCGFCRSIQINYRQFMVEFGKELIVIQFTASGQHISHTLAELLPFSFGPHDLGK